MRVDALSLTNFRNYARLELPLPPGVTVLHGDNAQGKTSLLEALYALAAGHSPYTTQDRQWIHWRTAHDPLPFARVAADIATHAHPFGRLEMTVMLEPGAPGGLDARPRKVVKLNGVEVRLMDVVGVLACVLFLPQDMALVEGPPTGRRRFMNDTLGQVDAAYGAALATYEKVLPQRNALLRGIALGHNTRKELAFWDEQLIEAGAVLVAGRQRLLRELEVAAQQVHADLTDRRETLTLRYQPAFAPTAQGNGQLGLGVLGLDFHRELAPYAVRPQLAAQFEAEREQSVARGVTLSGPHRDELRFAINDRDVSDYGSRGQARTAVLALKLAELAWMTRRLHEPPLLLLDEVAAELDAHRRAYLLDRLEASGAQTVVTTAELDILPAPFVARAHVLHVHDGRIALP